MNPNATPAHCILDPWSVDPERRATCGISTPNTTQHSQLTRTLGGVMPFSSISSTSM